MGEIVFLTLRNLNKQMENY